MFPNTTPNVRFACITDPTRQHTFFFAAAEEDFDRLVAAYEQEDDLTVAPLEFTDPRIVNETRVWVADARQDGGRPSMVMVGSVENGQWVNRNLPAVPRPPVP